ncbi:hypothetical protein PGB90_002870 [Kerria lacca]
MMNNFQIESGVQFLTRIKNSKYSLKNIDNVLFTDGLKEGDIIEISAETVYYKNLILIHFLKKIALINEYSGISVGGLNSGIIFIDTAFELNINKLVRCMQCSINNLLCSPEDKKEIIRKSLENIIMIRCYDNKQLFLTFQSLYNIILSNSKIKFIILDNIKNNYCQNLLSDKSTRVNLYEKKCLSVFQNCIKDFKVTSFYVKPNLFYFKNLFNSKEVNYKLHIEEKNELQEVSITQNRVSKKLQFGISSDGIFWL